MSVLLRKILWYRSSTPSIAINITDAISMDSTRDLDITNNIFNLRLKNSALSFNTDDIKVMRYVDASFNNMFDEQDQIKIWIHYSDDFAEIEQTYWNNNTEEPTSTYLIGSYYVIDVDQRDTLKDTSMKLTCADKTYIIFNKLLAQAFPASDNLTAPKIIQKIIRLTSENVDGEYTGTGSDAGVKYDIQANLESEGGFIQDTRRTTTEDGNTNSDTAFPTISLSKVWKPVYEWLSDLSQIENLNTDDELTSTGGKEIVYGRPFIYYIDEFNRYHWFETNNTISSTINISTTKNIKNYSLKKAVFDVINFIVYRGGEDFYGKGTLDYYLSPSTNAKTLKMRVIAMTDIAKNLIQAEIAKGNLVSNTSGTFTFSGNRYNRNGTVTALWNNTAYSTDSDYNTALRTEILRRGLIRAQKVADGLGTARYKGTLEIKGTTDYTVGDLINITNTNTGQNAQNIRIIGIRNNLSKSAWFTTLELEQDQQSIIESST